MNFVTLITLEYNRSIRVQVGKDTMSHTDFIFFDDGEFSNIQAKGRLFEKDNYNSNGRNKEHNVRGFNYSILNECSKRVFLVLP